MDKLSEHNIRMLEIADANDIPGIGNKQLKDIAIAVYDTILQVQMLKMADCETCGHWWKSEEVCLLDDCQYEPKTEPQTIRCPKCGRTDYIRDMKKDMGIKGSHYKYKCINCNTYIKDEPHIVGKHADVIIIDEPQAEEETLREQCRVFMGIVEQTERSE